jgi:hypothetical protein
MGYELPMFVGGFVVFGVTFLWMEVLDFAGLGDDGFGYRGMPGEGKKYKSRAQEWERLAVPKLNATRQATRSYLRIKTITHFKPYLS